MAYIYRLIILCMLSSGAWAFPATSGIGWQVLYHPSTLSATKAEAAQKNCVRLGQSNAVYTSNGFGYAGPGWLCGTNYFSHEINGFVQGSILSCPSGSTLSGSQCTCNSGYIEIGGNSCSSVSQQDDKACADYAAANTGKEDQKYAGVVDSGLTCLPTPGVSSGKGCGATFERAMRAWVDPSWWSLGTTVRSGGSCVLGTGQGGVQPAPEALKCPIGQQMGQVNGVDVCMPYNSKTPVVTDKETTKTGVDSAGNPTSTTEKSKTTCVDGKCTTETTTTTTGLGPDGQPTTTTKTGTTGESKSDYCTKNPKTVECGGSGENSFSGSCMGSFKCEGDALMCAMASEQHKRNCQLFVNKTEESDLYDEAKALDNTKSVTGDLTEDVEINSSKFDSTNILGSGSCITDKTVVIMSRSISLPFSKVCIYLGYLGSVLMMVSFLLAARIVSRG